MAHGEKERAQAGVEGNWVQVGALGASHGVRGDVRLKSFTEKPLAIFKFSDLRLGAGGEKVKLIKKSKTKDGFVAHVEGVNSPEEASALKTKGLYVQRDILESADADEFFLADLIGLMAVGLDGERLGVVVTLDNFGADDLLEITLDEPVKGLGKSVFIPFTLALVPEIDLNAGTATIDFAGWQETQTSERDVEGFDSEEEIS
jgi:16S rRNA processing protein RimM